MKRLFEPTRSPHQSSFHNIRVVSYNILADKYKGYHPYCATEHLDWLCRYPRLLQEITTYSPDILCLQEVEQTVYDHGLQPWMQQQGYSSFYQPRKSAAGQPGPDEGVSLHYKSDSFTTIAAKGLTFAEGGLTEKLVANSNCSRVQHEFCKTSTTSVSSMNPHRLCSSHKGEHRFFRQLMLREEGCVMALLQHTASQQLLLACSAHLFWNPQFPDVKVVQAAVMCSSIAEFIQHQGGSIQDVAVVIGGDFNSLPEKHASDKWDQVPAGQSLQSGVYQLLQRGHLHPSHPDHPARRTCRSGSQQQGKQHGVHRACMSQLEPVRQQQQPQRRHATTNSWQSAAAVNSGVDRVAFLNEQLGSDLNDLDTKQPVQHSQQQQPIEHSAGKYFSAADLPQQLHVQQQPTATAEAGLHRLSLGSMVLSADSSWDEDAASIALEGFAAAAPDDATTVHGGSNDGNSSSSSGGSSTSGSGRGSSSSTRIQQQVFDTAGLQLASSAWMGSGREPVLTTRTATFSGCLDYIWLSKQHFHVTQLLAMPYPQPSSGTQGSPEELVSSSVFAPCPNELFPSDHLAVGCEVALTSLGGSKQH